MKVARNLTSFLTLSLIFSLLASSEVFGFTAQPLVITRQRIRIIRPTPVRPYPTPTPPPPKADHFKDHYMTPIASPYYVPGNNNLSSTQTADLALQAWKTGLNDVGLQPFPCTLQTQLTPTTAPPAQENQIVQGSLGSNIVALTSITLGQGTPPALKQTWQGYVGSPNPTFPITYATRASIALSTSIPFGEKDQLSMFRYDLYRVLLHELGHALGLLDNTLPLSIMNGTLITQGPLSIDLTAADKLLAGNHNCH